MKNNKILISLVAASIAAMTAAPELLKYDSDNKNENKKTTVLKIPQKLSAEQIELSQDAKNQVSAILNKKSPVMKVSESVSILVENYGSKDESIKEKIYKELKLTANNQDSTSVGPSLGTYTNTTPPGTPVLVCHSACHGACHSACHGSRGWR